MRWARRRHPGLHRSLLRAELGPVAVENEALKEDGGEPFERHGA